MIPDKTTTITIIVTAVGDIVDNCWFEAIEPTIIVYRGEAASRDIPTYEAGSTQTCYCPYPGIVIN